MPSRSLKPQRKNYYRQFSVLLFLVPGIYTILKDHYYLGAFMVAAGLLFQASLFKKATTSSIGKKLSKFSLLFENGLVCFFAIALALVTLVLPFSPCDNFKAPWFPFEPLVWMQWVLFLGLIGAFMNMKPSGKATNDFSPWFSRICLWAILAAAFAIRFYHPNTPEGCFNMDEASEANIIRNVHDFDIHRYIFDFGEDLAKPFYAYWMLFWWHWFPNASDLLIMRTAAATLDVLTVGTLYLLGKDLGGRRAGILAALIGAFSKPLIDYVVTGTFLTAVPFSIALALLFTLRLFKKPDLSHFIQWGAALSFSVYSNDYCRIDYYFFMGSIFFWILSKKENRKWNGPLSLFILTNLFLIGVYHLYSSSLFPADSFISQLIRQSGFLLFCLFAALLIFSYRIRTSKNFKNKIWLDFIIGLWICSLIDWPMLTSGYSLDRLGNFLTHGGVFDDSLGRFVYMVEKALRMMFQGSSESLNMGLVNDYFFGYGDAVLIFVGLAYVLAKPNWLRFFILLSAFFGFVPYVIAGNPHMGRLGGAIVPFLLLGALAIDHLLGSFSSIPNKRWFYVAACTLFLLFEGWNSQVVLSRVYSDWVDKQEQFYVTASKDVKKLDASEDRIYFSGELFGWISIPLNEGRLVYCLFPKDNYIYLSNTDLHRNVVIILSPDEYLLKRQLVKTFPTAQWTNGNICSIPFPTLLKTPQHLFILRRESPSHWTRQFSEYTFAFDLIKIEDEIKSVHQPAPKIGQDMSFFPVRYQSKIHIGTTGDYRIHWKAGNRIIMKIDGKTTLDLHFIQIYEMKVGPRDGNETVHLEKGDHTIEVMTSYPDIPEISLQLKGTSTPAVSLWDSFNFN